jgi:hypothetical protein
MAKTTRQALGGDGERWHRSPACIRRSRAFGARRVAAYDAPGPLEYFAGQDAGRKIRSQRGGRGRDLGISGQVPGCSRPETPSIGDGAQCGLRFQRERRPTETENHIDVTQLCAACHRYLAAHRPGRDSGKRCAEIVGGASRRCHSGHGGCSWGTPRGLLAASA